MRQLFRNALCRKVVCLLMGFMLAMGAGGAAEAAVGNFYNVIMQDGADPWVYKHTDGTYYFTKTTGANVTLWRAKTVTGLDAGDSKVIFTPPATGPNSKNIWAPEIHWINNAWYVYYAADDGNNANHRMFVLKNTSADPFQGTWTSVGKIYDAANDRWAIDGTVLQLDGRMYFIWSGWEGTVNDNQHLYIAPMDSPTHISGSRVKISSPTLAWERVGAPPGVNEGPQVLVRGTTVSIVYSAAGSWTDSYALGLLTASTSSDLMNPASWTKAGAPVFKSGNGVYGPGHCSFTTSPDGTEPWIVYHAARWQGSGWTRHVRAQKFTWNSNNTPNFGTPAAPNAPIAIPSGELLRDRYEAEHALLANGPKTAAHASASGGYKVGYIDFANSYVEFTVNGPSAGDYLLYARTGNGTNGAVWASHTLSVNGSAGTPLHIAGSGWDNWGTSTARITLNAGANKIRFTKLSNYAEIDCIDILPFR